MMKLKCDNCNNNATWLLMSGKGQYCDDCVPRGCSCNIDDDTDEESLDEFGRKYPCCEFWYDKEGYEDDTK